MDWGAWAIGMLAVCVSMGGMMLLEKLGIWLGILEKEETEE